MGNQIVDIIEDLAYGDCGKGKVSAYLAKSANYDFVAVCSGGPNRGHSYYYNNQLVKTHQIPSGVFYNIPSVICAGCLVEPITLLEEIEYVKSFGVKNVEKNLKIAYNAHIITQEHIDDDKKNDKVGSTKKGIMPCLRDKYGRVGKRVESCEMLKEFVCDTYELFGDSGKILVEGSQGHYLDVDGPSYPYASCNTTVSYCLHSLGVSPRNLRNVYGVIKPYTTYVGTKKFQPEGEIYNKIAEIGCEIGTTTGRKRQVDFLDLNMLIKAVRINGVNKLIVNKMDVLQEVDCWRMIVNGEIVNLETEENFKNYLRHFIPADVEITYSYSPKEI